MKKLLAVLCIVALLLAAAVPALANPSVSELEPEKVETKIVQQETDNVSKETQEMIDAGATVQVSAVTEDTIAEYKSEEVKEVVQAVNINQDTEQSVTVADVATVLNTETEAGTEGVEAVKVANSEDDKTVDLNDYSFVTGFTDIVLAGSEGNTVQSGEGETLTVEVKMTIPQLEGVKEEDLENYLLMLVNTASADVALLELDQENFDSDTGEITVELPFLGAVALIQNTAETAEA